MKANEIREALEGYKLTYVAEKAGIHINTLSRFMNGHDVKLSTAEKLATWIKEQKK